MQMQGSLAVVKVEAVNHPAHYQTAAGIEAIEVIEKYDLGFCLGSAFKYLTRAGKKSRLTELEDLKKAAWYLKRWRERPYYSEPAEDVWHWANPVKIVSAFGLSGPRASAVMYILNSVGVSSPDDQIGAAIVSVEREIRDATL